MLESWLTRRWYGDSAPLALRPFSSLYGCAMFLRQAAYARAILASHDVGKPVLVVGNLTAGGTGKTPLVIWLAQQLSALGLKVGIVSRGHGRREAAPRAVQVDSDWRLVGDEPLLLRRNTGCATVVAADRVAGARMLIAQGADVIVADDGLQHLRLRRNCEIAVVDGARGFGNGALLPAGPLREPVSRLGTVDAIVVNGEQPKGRALASLETHSTAEASLVCTMSMSTGNPQPVLGDAAARVATMADFRGQRVHAVAGIGNPGRFFADLRAQGLEVIEHPFADHHPYVAKELAFPDELPVLMTEKDAVKCGSFADSRLWYVPVAARFGEREGRELLERVLHKLGLIAHLRG